MRRETIIKNGQISIIEYLNEPAPPDPRPMNSAYLVKNGYKQQPGNCYEKGEVKVHYDGCSWWVYYWCAIFRIETIEEFEKLVV